jgi:hypothetical protein
MTTLSFFSTKAMRAYVCVKSLSCSMIIVMLLCLIGSSPRSALANPDQVLSPPHLQAWERWIKPQMSDLECAARGGVRACAWASKLHIELRDQGAQLSYDIQMDKADIVPLLGGDQVAIQELKAQQGEVVTTSPVVWRAQRAWVSLPRGQSRVEVNVTWSQMPDFLFIPPYVAQVTLDEGGKSRSWIERDARGAVWLKARRLVGQARDADKNKD